ncbi:polysaccharide deacetylase family protein [Chitiniphilus purpureus]|uniref:Polysaccharide deacetylase family protein n=1 Tax=Chitiniphilus purpureus TaxID=2981137 RepID=A0ABY6DR00_9NEIS|nr:polysaccharide deacetylase family protein [Chitiniphilus sp. CD1]UXY14338.1 polysaccharide deacetylase family protein [Chitiniphilus sp. CD1]
MHIALQNAGLVRRFCMVLLSGLLAGGDARGETTPAPARFVLTFDDGPSLWREQPTDRILAQLADNPVQPGIKALFFVQTGHQDHGAHPDGQALMQAACAAGHRLAVHTATAAGHVPHPRLAPHELAASLIAGRAAIAARCGAAAPLVRPPDWAFNAQTQAVYAAQGLGMLLTDVNARDGKIYGWNISLRRRGHLRSELARVLAAAQSGRLQPVAGVLPVIVTFHDTNTFTARTMREYLQILVEEARTVGLPLADPPFYAEGDALVQAAQQRATAGVYARTTWP